MSPKLRIPIIALFLIFNALPPTLAEPPPGVAHPGTDLWREIRHNNTDVGRTQVQGVDSNVLVNSHGQQWREFRMQQLVPYGAYLLGGVAGFILLFYLARGKIRIENGRSGETLTRFSVNERVAHWFLVALFMVLALTGLVLLYGRALLLPLLGAEAFAALAAACKEGHNLFGPIFVGAVLAVFFLWVKKNLYRAGDLRWLLRFGGMLGGGHVSAGYFNAGEKIWFWSMVLLGLVMSVSGLVLDFPLFGQGRVVMELALAVHGIGAVLFVALALGHIYLATLGTEGTLEGMTGGTVDTNWAKTHHDRWHEESRGRQAGPATDTPDEALDETPAAARGA